MAELTRGYLRCKRDQDVKQKIFTLSKVTGHANAQTVNTAGSPRGGQLSGMLVDRRMTRLLAAAMLLAAATGCTESPAEIPAETTPPATPSVDTGSSSQSSPPTTPPSNAEIASTAASDVVREFYAVLDRLRQDPDEPLDLLSTVTTGQELDIQTDLVERERRDGLRQIGDTAIVELVVQTVDLDNSGAGSGSVPTVQVDACYDVSNADLVDASGESVVREERPDRGWIRYTVTNDQWDSDPEGGWLVASGKTVEKDPCSGS